MQYVAVQYVAGQYVAGQYVAVQYVAGDVWQCGAKINECSNEMMMRASSHTHAYVMSHAHTCIERKKFMPIINK